MGIQLAEWQKGKKLLWRLNKKNVIKDKMDLIAEDQRRKQEFNKIFSE